MDTTLNRTDQNLIDCPLCGLKFRRAGSLCQGCGINKSCKTLRCPQCLYEFVEDSKIWNALVRFWGKLKGCPSSPLRSMEGMVPLSILRVGGPYKIGSLHSEDPLRMDRLASLGILPGSQIFLFQKKPSLIIQMGETEVALDAEIANDIYISKM